MVHVTGLSVTHFVSSLVSDFTPIVFLALCYGFYHARIQHLLDFKYPLTFTVFIFFADMLTVVITGENLEHSVQRMIKVYPFLYLTFLVTDALYRSIFPDRITWKAWHSLNALTNNTVRVGMVMALYTGFLLVSVQSNEVNLFYLDVFPQSPILTVGLSVLIFHALPLLIGHVFMGAPWYLMALFSALISAGFVFLQSGWVAFFVAVGCGVLVSALFWCFGIWPTILASLMHHLMMIFPHPQLQLYLGALVSIFLIGMLVFQVIFENQYLSIGAYSLKKRAPILLFETLHVGAVPRHFLLIAIGVLGLGLKFSDVSLNQNSRLVPIAYDAAIAKSREVLHARGIKDQAQMHAIARMVPLDISLLDRVRQSHQGHWRQLIPAFIKWGCWQVLTYTPNRLVMYESLICQNRQWTQVHTKHVIPGRLMDESQAVQVARTAIGDVLNLLPEHLSFTSARLDEGLKGDQRWHIRYDISNYLAPNDIGLYALVDVNGSKNTNVYLDIDPPQDKKSDGYWWVWRMFASSFSAKTLLVSSLLIAIYVFGRRVSWMFELTWLNISSFVLMGVFVSINFQQGMNARLFDWVMDAQQADWLNPVIPMLQVGIYALLLNAMMGGSYYLQQYYPPLSFFAVIVSGAVGSLFWILYVGLAIVFGDILPLELGRLWVFFLPHASVFSSMMLLYWLLVVGILTFWGRILVSGDLKLHALFLTFLSLAFNYYAQTPTQSMGCLLLVYMVYPLWIHMMRWYGLRVVVPFVSFPLIYWVSWVLPMARLDVKVAGGFILIALSAALIAVMVQSRKREVLT